MGEKKYDLSRMPNDTTPFVDWDLERPDAALDRLCQSVNAHVVLRSDDVAAIYPDGFGADMPNLPSSSASQAFEFGVVPGKVSVTTAPFTWQLDFELQPVGLELDGSIVLPNELSYTPKIPHGWLDASNPEEFPGIPEEHRPYAIESVFRWYKIVPPKGRMPIAGTEITSIDQLLPLLENQIDEAEIRVEDKAKVKGKVLKHKRQKLAAQVWGWFYNEGGTARTMSPSSATTRRRTRSWSTASRSRSTTNAAW